MPSHPQALEDLLLLAAAMALHATWAHFAFIAILAISQSPHAYRSKSYGLLSLLCFLRRLADFTGKHDPWFGIVATDSQGLINTVLPSKVSAISGVENHLSAEGPLPPCSFP
jgi:hypothetical protein